MKGIENGNLSFKNYTILLEKYINTDWREINFQNRIVLPMLENIFIDKSGIEIVDVSTQYKNRESNSHTRKYYANNYSPDLLLVKNWLYYNKKISNHDYLAVVELKSPRLDSLNKIKKHTEEEVQSYLDNGRSVILTNCLKWIFYGFSDKPIPFVLYDRENEWGKDLEEYFDSDEYKMKSDIWDGLISYITDTISFKLKSVSQMKP